MLSHADVWRGVDRLAEVNGLSPSGLARRAGLDPTTFNKSKRNTRDGRPRWPSTESLAKILDATQTTLGEFVSLVQPGTSVAARATIPCVRLSAAAVSQFDGAGFPQASFERIELSHLDARHLYALEIDRDDYAPVYRNGDTVLISPGVGVRRHDRVALMPKGGELRLGVLQRRTAERLTLMGLKDPEEVSAFAPADVSWLARIVWVSQ
ncbi:MAG: helix-turn-helix transcriptional regulator [Geminicoccaceae bacterium]|nr:MAG: helix-turn-helix transcriptional regulator [Geminicoccaceae bacterium]